VGALLGEVTIMGSNLAAEGVGTTAFGQPHNYGTINANYKLPWVPALSADITVVQATLRVQVQNVTNYYFWNMGYSPGFFQSQPRAYFGYLTADF
jgi:hypothetical protein